MPHVWPLCESRRCATCLIILQQGHQTCAKCCAQQCCAKILRAFGQALHNMIQESCDLLRWNVGSVYPFTGFPDCYIQTKVLLNEAATASGEITDSKPHQTAKYHTNENKTTKRKWTLFIWLTVDHSLGSKDAKSSILWSFSRDQLNQSEVSRNKLQKMHEIK